MAKKHFSIQTNFTIETWLQKIVKVFQKSFLRLFFSFSIIQLFIIQIVENLSRFVSKPLKIQIYNKLYCELNMNFFKIICYQDFGLNLSPKLTSLNNKNILCFKKKKNCCLISVGSSGILLENF